MSCHTLDYQEYSSSGEGTGGGAGLSCLVKVLCHILSMGRYIKSFIGNIHDGGRGLLYCEQEAGP